MASDFRAEADSRAKNVAFTYLIRNGIPSQPVDVVELCMAVFQAGIAWSVGEEYTSLNEKGRATTEEKEESRTRIAEARSMQERFAAALQGVADEDPSAVLGQYL